MLKDLKLEDIIYKKEILLVITSSWMEKSFITEQLILI